MARSDTVTKRCCAAPGSEGRAAAVWNSTGGSVAGERIGRVFSSSEARARACRSTVARISGVVEGVVRAGLGDVPVAGQGGEFEGAQDRRDGQLGVAAASFGGQERVVEGGIVGDQDGGRITAAPGARRCRRNRAGRPAWLGSGHGWSGRDPRRG